MTSRDDWEKVEGDVMPRQLDSVPYTGNDEWFTPNITEEELASLMDANGDNRFESVFEWMLPKYGEQDYFEFIAARMQNYMLHIIRHKDFKPKHYKPNLGHTIQIAIMSPDFMVFTWLA